MSDIRILRKRGSEQHKYLLVPETEHGKRILGETFQPIGNFYEITAEDNEDLEKIIDQIQASEGTVEVQR